MESKFNRQITLYTVKNPHKYFKPFEKFRKLGGQFSPTWHWPAFFVPTSWFLYRKMYLWAAVALFVWHGLFPLGAIVTGMTGNWLYYKKMQDDFKVLKGIEDKKFALQQMGGVHAWVPYVSVFLHLLQFISGLAALGGLWFLFTRN